MLHKRTKFPAEFRGYFDMTVTAWTPKGRAAARDACLEQAFLTAEHHKRVPVVGTFKLIEVAPRKVPMYDERGYRFVASIGWRCWLI